MEEEQQESTAFDDLDILFGFDKIGEKKLYTQKSPDDVIFSLIQTNGFVYWLRAQVLQYEFLKKDGISFCRESVQNNARGQYPIKLSAFVKSLVEYYLLSTFATRFDPARGLDQSLMCSLSVLTERLLDMEQVRQILTGTFKSTTQKYLEHPAQKT